MPSSLIIFLMILGIVSIYIIYNMVKRKKMLISHAILWYVLIISIMIASLSTKEIKQIATFIGIKEVSNLIFFIGFIILLILNLILTVNISKQKSTINNLVQEIALTNKRLEDINDFIAKKNNRKI